MIKLRGAVGCSRANQQPGGRADSAPDEEEAQR